MLLFTERQDIHQAARRWILCFFSAVLSASQDNPVLPVVKREAAVAEFEEWVNAPLNEGGDEVQQYAMEINTMQVDQEILCWQKGHSGSCPLL